MTTITVDINPQVIDITRRVDGAIIEVGRDELLTIALKASQMIKQRTAAGQSVNGNTFAVYSPFYREVRADKGLPVEPPDLFFRGNMLASIDAEAPMQDMSRLFFRSQAEGDKAIRHNEGYGVPQRRFFELNENEVEDLADFINTRLGEIMDEALN